MSDGATRQLADRRFGFIGGGAMAEALAGGLLGSGVSPERIRIADPDPARQKHLHETHGLSAGSDNAEAVAGCDVVVVAVKPNVAGAALSALREGGSDVTQPLWISIAAGVSLATLESALGAGARIVRAMPNTPALVHAGATAIHANAAASAEDRATAHAFFAAVGTCWEAPNEGLLDAVTGLSGSGPAYVFVFLEALGDAGLVPFNLRVMSGNHAECGICLQPFSSDDGGGDASARPTAVRHVFWPCQHVRQCGECAIRIWQTPKAKRRCPWCKSKIEIRPRAFKPFL